VFHGERDYRVPYTQGLAAFNCARMMNIPAKLIVFPEETHWVLRPQNAILWQREFFAWMDKWLKF
jgi:dipeptidyl aminopeptidase/acylaminoacyl peptidase